MKTQNVAAQAIKAGDYIWNAGTRRFERVNEVQVYPDIKQIWLGLGAKPRTFVVRHPLQGVARICPQGGTK